MAVAKFSAQYAKDGVLFMSISPGTVDVGQNANGMLYLELCAESDGMRLMCCSDS